MNKIMIKSPRWHDRTVLIADYKVQNDNVVDITAKRKDGTRYFPNEIYVKGRDILDCPKVSNGTINCYAVPLDKMLGVTNARK